MIRRPFQITAMSRNVIPASWRFFLIAILMLPSQNLLFAQTAPVCTTTTLGKEEFLGISGSSDSNVVGVGKKGTIVAYDGVAWAAVASPTNEELNDVEVVDANTAFAVGKKGTVVRLQGGTWVLEPQFTNEDLLGVWAASATEAYAVGKKGEIWAYNGTVWVEQSAVAGTNNKDIEDVWGDVNGVHAINNEGRIYSYDRLTASWAAADTLCEVDNKFRDIWGDGSGSLYTVNKEEVYRHNGSSCQIVATASEDLLTIYGSANGRIYAAGQKGVVIEFNGSSWIELTPADEDINDVYVSPAGGVYYAGKKSSVTTCAAPSSATFVVIHDGYGIHCVDESVQIDVVDGNAGTPLTNYSEQITLDTQSGNGTWILLAGSGALTDATADDGVALYQWPLNESSATFALAYRQGAATIDIDVFQSSDSVIRDNDAEGVMTFSASGFSVTAAPLSNPPPVVILPFAAPQVAAVDFPVYLTAYGQTPGDPSCGVIETYSGSRDLQIWQNYANPVSGTITASIDGLALATSEAAAATQTVTFTNGQATVAGSYDDAGQIRIFFNDDNVADPNLPNGIRGATAPFVVRPATFTVSGIADSLGNLNPAPVDASGAGFVAAGAAFTLTVTALNADGNVTPNFGQEIAPETVTLGASLMAPAGGNNPPMNVGAGLGPFSAGQATGNSFSWPEVGIIQLIPSVGDGSYLGAGDVIGATSENVGRFYPAYFSAVQNGPAFATSCAAGSFTYIGESFTYATPPVLTVTAHEAGGGTTRNYAGAFFRIDNSTLQNRTYAAAAGSLDATGLPAPASDPVIAPLGNGVATLTFSAGSGLAFTKGAPEPAFAADITLGIDVLDADGVAVAANPVVFGTGGGIMFNAGNDMRYGRTRLHSALGSELVNLSVVMRNEYFLSAAAGFVVSSDDSCANAVTLSFSNFTDNLTAGETCVIENGAPGDSGVACTTAGPFGLRYREPPLGGDFNLYLAAPGDGNNGSLVITADVPAWLQFNWDASTLSLENPAGIATFGIYRGEDRRIYTREIY